MKPRRPFPKDSLFPSSVCVKADRSRSAAGAASSTLSQDKMTEDPGPAPTLIDETTGEGSRRSPTRAENHAQGRDCSRCVYMYIRADRAYGTAEEKSERPKAINHNKPSYIGRCNAPLSARPPGSSLAILLRKLNLAKCSNNFLPPPPRPGAADRSFSLSPLLPLSFVPSFSVPQLLPLFVVRELFLFSSFALFLRFLRSRRSRGRVTVGFAICPVPSGRLCFIRYARVRLSLVPLVAPKRRATMKAQARQCPS